MISAGFSPSSSDPSSSGVRTKTSGVPTRRAVSPIRATNNRSLTTATTRGATLLIVLLRVTQPVLVPLGEMGERAEVLHAVEVDDAVEVVDLVLDHAGEELLGDHVHLRAVAVIGLEPDRRVASHHPAHVRHREAPLPAVLRLFGQRGDDRVDQHREWDAGGVRVARVAVDLDNG